MLYVARIAQWCFAGVSCYQQVGHPLLLLSPCCSYISGRTRAPGEINGKSGNLNNALRNIIYQEYEQAWDGIPHQELVVVFDADMACKRNFFMKVLGVMWDGEVALCLTPQVRRSHHELV